MKKSLSLLLALVMLIGLLPVTSLASENEETAENPWNGKSAVFVGDSITAGVGTTKIYYQYLNEVLDFRSVTAMGVGGSCISAASDYGQTNQPLINRYQNIPSADIILIFIGTNDYGHETPLGNVSDIQDGTFYGALNVIIPALVAKHTSSKIVFVTPLHRYGFGTSKILGTPFTFDSVPNGVGATLGDYVEALKTVCANNGVSVIDLYTECTLDPTDSSVRTAYMPDGLHPNAAGHEMIAEILASHIRDYSPAESVPGTETEPEVKTELIYGNKFASGFSQKNRASSKVNLYLKAGTIITFKNIDTMQWSCAKTSSETSSNNLGYFPDSAWSDKETAVVEADGWVGFVFKYRDETQAFDLTKPLSDYITIEEPHTHAYQSTITAPTCTEQGHTVYTCSVCGDSYRTPWLDKSAYAGKTIACVGDSITAAHGVTKDETDYVTLLAQQLGMDYIRLGDSGTTLCTDGNRICNIRRLTEDYLQGADVVTIALGINDFCNAAEGYYELGDINSTDSSTIYGAARMWCERIVELRKTDSLSHTQFYFVTPVITSWNNSVTTTREWDQSKTNIHGYTLRDLCNGIIEVAALYDVAVIDLNLLSGMYYVDAEDNNTAVFGGDGVHPGTKGHEMMANALANALLQNNLRDDHTHTLGSWITTTWPSCIAGEQKRICSICSATENRTLESGDNHRYSAVVTAPTHTEQGYTTYTCSLCGDSYVGDFTAPTALNNYRWELQDNALVSVTDNGNTANTLTMTTGTITGGTLTSVRCALQDPIRLRHDKPWVIEWRSRGDWDGMLFGSTMDSSIPGLTYLFRYAPMRFLAFGEFTGKWNNYGIIHEIDMTVSHVFRLENRIAEDGFNAVYLLVDGQEIDVMHHYYIGGSNQNKTVNWANSKDLVFSNLGTSSHPISGMQLDYLQIWEDGHEHAYQSTVTAPTCTEQGYTTYTCTCGDSYVDCYVDATGEHIYENGICTGCNAEHPNMANLEGKVISVLGDSISTFAGYIPTADGFNLEHLARYPQDNLLTDVNETWWMQVISTFEAKLGINDSWRGATVSGAVPVTTGSTGENAAMGNLQRIKNLGANGTPDVILFYGGTNDLAHVSKVGTFDAANAPSAVDLTTTKWDNLADGYVHTLLRLQYFYPDAQIIAMLPTYTNGYYSDKKLAEGNAVLAAICEHYGVTYVDLRECGISTADLPDNIHPDATGMDYITTAVIDTLLNECELEAGENVVHSVTHKLTYAESSMGYYKGVSQGKPFVAVVTGEDVNVCVTMGGVDITHECYANGKITIDKVTGALVITANGTNTLKQHLQQLPDFYCGVNLWKVLEHDPKYYSATGWTTHSSAQVKSITFPVRPGDRLYASSFEAAGPNGSSTDGIRVSYFTENGLLVSMTASQVYSEFCQNGCLTVPEGATAVSIPMWTDSQDWDVHFLCALDGHLQQIPVDSCNSTNLWSLLEHDTKYYSANGWAAHSSGEVMSVTFPVIAGDRLYASSFGAAGTNGSATNGIRVTYFTQCGVLVSLTADQVYSQFSKYGCLTVPEGATAVSIPMWNNSDENELYILNRDHSYENGICICCGAEQERPVVGWNLTLGADIGMNFLLGVDKNLADQTYVHITVADNETVSYKVSDLTPDKNGNYLFRVNVSAAQMTDAVKLQLFTGDQAGEIYTYTVAQYAEAVLSDESLVSFHGLVKEMLNYGAAAQLHFGYNLDKPIDKKLYEGAGAKQIYETANMSVSGKIDGLTFHGATLLHQSKTALRFYFAASDMSRFTVSVGENILKPVQKDGLWYVEIGDILPQSLNESVTVKVVCNEDRMTISYCPMNYIIRMSQKGSDSLQALLKAMYNYHLAAKALP